MLQTGIRQGINSKGFTLFELLVVLLILGLFASFFTMKIDGIFSGGDLRLASRMVIGEISRLRGKAAYTHKDHYLQFNVDDNTFSPIEPASENKGETTIMMPEGIGENSNQKKLPKGVDLMDVVVFPLGKFQNGEVKIKFFANGCVDRSLIHLENEEGETYSLEVNPLTGQVSIYDKYIDQKTIP